MFLVRVGSLLDALFFFFKQKTAYEMRISDWSSDVCSSDLWTAKALRTAHRPSAGDFYERASAYQKEIAQKDDLYFLSYDGGWFENDTSISQPYWFLDVLRLYKFRREPDPEFIKTHGHSEGSALKQHGPLDWGPKITWRSAKSSVGKECV